MVMGLFIACCLLVASVTGRNFVYGTGDKDTGVVDLDQLLDQILDDWQFKQNQQQQQDLQLTMPTYNHPVRDFAYYPTDAEYYTGPVTDRLRPDHEPMYNWEDSDDLQNQYQSDYDQIPERESAPVFPSSQQYPSRTSNIVPTNINPLDVVSVPSNPETNRVDSDSPNARAPNTATSSNTDNAVTGGFKDTAVETSTDSRHDTAQTAAAGKEKDHDGPKAASGSQQDTVQTTTGNHRGVPEFVPGDDELNHKDTAPALAVSASHPEGAKRVVHVNTDALEPTDVQIKHLRHHNMSDIYFIVTVSGLCILIVGMTIGGGFCYHRMRRRAKDMSDAEYPAYGITGPNKELSPNSGDRKLAQSAQMYHYQHQKQQMMAMEKNHSGRLGSASDVDSDEENEEGDYTVYECPGLAPSGEMEVKNPLFQDDTTPAKTLEK